MNSKFSVKALCSDCFGMNTIMMYVDYDSEQPIDKFFKDCRSAMFRAGYTSILHWKSIDDCEYAKIIFKMQDCEPFVRNVIELLTKRQWFTKHIDCIEQAKEGKEIEGVWRNKEGDLIARGWNEESLKREKRSIESTLHSYKDCLSMLGVDVDDTEDKKRILTNLGFYRVDLQ